MVFIYASNKPFCGTLIINLRKELNLHAPATRLKHPLEESNKNTKCVLAI